MNTFKSLNDISLTTQANAIIEKAMTPTEHASLIAEKARMWATADPRDMHSRPMTNHYCREILGRSLTQDEWLEAVEALSAEGILEHIAENALRNFGSVRHFPAAMQLFPYGRRNPANGKTTVTKLGLILWLAQLGLYDLDSKKVHPHGIVVAGAGLITPDDAARIYANADRRNGEPSAQRVAEIMMEVNTNSEDTVFTPRENVVNDQPSQNFGQSYDPSESEIKDDQNAIAHVTSAALNHFESLYMALDPASALSQIQPVRDEAIRLLNNLHKSGKITDETLDAEIQTVNKEAIKTHEKLELQTQATAEIR